MICPNCKTPILPLDLESDWQVVRCRCGKNVEIGHGEPVIREPATVEDFREAAARFAFWNNIYWRRFGPVYQRLDFEFWQQKENRPPEPPSEAAQDLQDIKGELTYIKDKVSSIFVKKKKEKGIY